MNANKIKISLRNVHVVCSKINDINKTNVHIGKRGYLVLNNVCLFIFIAKFFMIRPRTPLIFLEHSDPCAMGMKSILSISDVWFSFYFYCFPLPGDVIYPTRIALFEKFETIWYECL